MAVFTTTQNNQRLSVKESRCPNLFSYSVIWTVVLLVLFDLALIYFQPFKYIQIPGVVLRQQDHIDYKIQSVLSFNNSFDTLLMGSSLAEAASINADASLGLEKPTVYSAARYNHAVYFDRLKKEKLKIDSTTFSSAIGGSMISDQALILQKVFTKSKLPKQVFLMIEPRAFIDATRTPDLYPVTCYMNWRYKNIWNVNGLSDGLNLILSSFWNFFNYRSDFSTLLNTLAENKFKSGSKSVNLVLEDQDYKYDRSLDPKSVEESAIYYKKAYEKVEEQKFQTQIASLHNIIEMCKKNRVELVLIAAPLAKLNRDLLPEGFENRYNNTLANISKKQNIAIYNLTATDKITDSDYIDYVHLNSKGALKFWQLAVNLIGSSNESKR